MLGGSGSSNDSDTNNGSNRNVTYLCLINQYLRQKERIRLLKKCASFNPFNYRRKRV